MFRKKNKRFNSIDTSNTAATNTRFSFIPALSKLSRSKSASKEAFAVGEQEAIKNQSEKGFFARLFSSKKDDPVPSSAPPLQRKPSLWQRSKSFLKSKAVEVPVEDSLSTIDLPRVRKTQLPKLKIKGSGAALKVDFSGFVLGKPEVNVDTDALLQRMFEMNEQPYQELRSKYVSNEIAYLSPVMTAVTLSELSKPESNEANDACPIIIESLHSEAEQHHYQLEHHNQAFSDNPQLDSPLLSVSGTLVEEDEIFDNMSDRLSERIIENADYNTNEIMNNNMSDDLNEYENNSDQVSDISNNDQSIGSVPSDWSITRLNEEFDVLNVKTPTRHSDGSIHFHFDDSEGGSAESIVFEDWRRTEMNEQQQQVQQQVQPQTDSTEQKQSFQSLDSVPRAVAPIEASFRARSVSNSLLTGSAPRKTLGTRISQIVAIFERGLQEELNSNV